MVADELQLSAESDGMAVPIARSVASGAMRLGGMVIGYNHNVPYEGRMYHVQTEDSGRAKGRICTHVFNSGTIVASNRIDYDCDTEVSAIIELARASHKLMMRRLVHGEFDGEITGGAALAAAVPANGPHSEEGSLAGHRKRIQQIIEVLDMDEITATLERVRSDVAGTLGVALVDYESGMCLGTSGTGIDVEVAAAGNMEVMKVEARVMRELGIKGGIEDILITLESQYHVIRPVGATLFLYLAIDRQQGNLALARHKLASAAADVKM